MLYSLRKSLVLLGVLTALAVPPVQAVSPDELFEVLQRIESLENEVRFLRGENEQLRYDIEDVKNTQKSTFIRIDDRMDDLFRAMNSRSEVSVPPPPPLAVAPQTSVVEKIAEVAKLPITAVAKPVVSESKVITSLPKSTSAVKVKKPVLVKRVPSESAVVLTVKTDAKKTVVANNSEKAAYNAALSKVKAKPVIAITQFRDFLKKYPQSPLAADAQYWLGEMMYSSRNYKGAVNEFVTVLQNYSASPKAPDAAMKLGLSFYEMKNWVYARRTLEDVARNYPKTAAANFAQTHLAKMKADNLY